MSGLREWEICLRYLKWTEIMRSYPGSLEDLKTHLSNLSSVNWKRKRGFRSPEIFHHRSEVGIEMDGVDSGIIQDDNGTSPNNNHISERFLQFYRISALNSSFRTEFIFILDRASKLWLRFFLRELECGIKWVKMSNTSQEKSYEKALKWPSSWSLAKYFHFEIFGI